MGEQKIAKIYNIVSKYVNKYLRSSLIDYYDLFEIDKNKSCEEITLELKKLKVLLHPDLKLYLPEFMREYYTEVIEEFVNCEAMLSDSNVRKNYDERLSKMKNKSKENTQKQNNEQESTSKNTNPVKEDELDKVITALELTMKAHGLVFTMNNVKLIIENQITNSWENHFSKESRKGLKELGEEKFKEIIRKFAPKSNSSGEITIDCFTYLYQIQNVLKELMLPFENVCIKTLEKYNPYQLKMAITDFVYNDSAKKFTNTDNSRELFLTTTNPLDIIPFIRIYLNSFKAEDESYGYENLKSSDVDSLIELFVNKFSSEYQEKIMQ